MPEINLEAGCSSTAETMEEGIAELPRGDTDVDWEHVQEVLVSELALADMASKLRLLQSLSSFLSDMAASMSSSKEVHTMPAWVEDSAVFLGHKQVSQVHELVVRELKEQTCFLSESSSTKSKEMDEGAIGNPTRALNIGIVSQALRCCIRILPLVDIFDKSAGLASTRMLDGMLQQLCHPTKLSHLLGLTATEATPPDLPIVDFQHRKELILAILEVFMDEVLLSPNLFARLLSSRPELCQSLASETITCYIRHTEASLEAAFAHVFSAAQPVALPLSSPVSSRREVFLGCNLSLPAGLILLEKSSGEDIPLVHIAHIARFLARILNDTTPLGFGQVEEFSRARKVGGVDWSYCCREQLAKGDLGSKHLIIDVLQPETTLTFASSILEHAILLYTRFSVASHTRGNAGGLVAALLQLMRSSLNCIGRAVCMLALFPEAVGEEVLRAGVVSFSGSATGDSEKILECVGVYLNLCLPAAKTLGSIYEEPRYARVGEDERDLNRAACPQGPLNLVVGQAIGFFSNVLRGEVQGGAPEEVLEEYFHFVESLVALSLVLDERRACRLDLQRVRAAGPGHTARGFSNQTCQPCQEPGERRSMPEVQHKWGARGCACVDHRSHGSLNYSPGRYLEDMVASLKGMLQDLSNQKRTMPEFLLFFMFKQLKKRDALRLVETGFRSSLHRHLYDQQSVTHSTESFQSEGLVAEVLQLALSEPTRPLSPLIFMVQLVDIIQDVVPITATLTLSEITELISWFETIARSLTSASRLAACEPIMLARNGKQQFQSFVSKLGQGIDRIITEGSAAAHWLADLAKTMSEDAWHKLAGDWKGAGCSKLPVNRLGGRPEIAADSFGKLNSFLSQVDMLRKAVAELARSGDPSLHRELNVLVEKGRTFFAAWSDLLTGKHFRESRPSERHEQRPSGSETHCHVQSIPTEPVVDELVDGQQTASPSNAVEAAQADIVVEGIEEPAGTPARESSQTDDQSAPAENGPGSEELTIPTEKCLLDKEEEIRTQAGDGLSLSAEETPLVSLAVRIEKRQTRSATARMMQKGHTVAEADVGAEIVAVGAESPVRAPPKERKQCSPRTTAIIRRLLETGSPAKKICSSRSAGVSELSPEVEKTLIMNGGSCNGKDGVVVDGDLTASSNTFVDSLSGRDPNDTFDDLKDFIVPKKGRDYSKWLKGRQKFRRRLYSKNFFKRLREKRELLLMLDS